MSQPTPPPALRLRARRLGYPQHPPVLEGLDLTFQAGERVALVGGNGAGKTTLLKACVGLLSGAGVTLELGGGAIRSVASAVAAGVGMVFQNPDDQLFGATVGEDVASGPRNQGLAADEVTRRVRAALEAVGLVALDGRPIETLSFGEKKRACLAGVLAMQPSILLLDEPTAGLDPGAELAFLAHLDRLRRERGITLVCATHAIDLVPHLADRLLLLGEGRVLADGSLREVLAGEAQLAKSGLRQPIVTQLARRLKWNSTPLTLEEAERTWNARQL